MERDIRARVDEARAVPEVRRRPVPGRAREPARSGSSTGTRPRSMYPYSQSTSGEQGLASDFNYVRNSVKATVDAYEGTVTFYVFDPKDPIIQAWRKAFPDLFTDASQMSAELRDAPALPRRPVQGAGEPCSAATTSPSRAASTTAARSGWSRPTPDRAGVGDRLRGADRRRQLRHAAPTRSRRRPRRPGKRIDPYYLYLKLPEGRRRSTSSSSTPFVPVSSDNTSDAARVVPHRELRSRATTESCASFTMPQGETVLGPVQVNNEINRTSAISQRDHAAQPAGLAGHAGEPAADPGGQLVCSTCGRSTCRAPAAGASRSSSSSSSSPRTSGSGLRADRERRRSTSCSRQRRRPSASCNSGGHGHRRARRRPPRPRRRPDRRPPRRVRPPRRCRRRPPGRCETSSTRREAKFAQADAALDGGRSRPATRRSRQQAPGLVAQAQTLALRNSAAELGLPGLFGGQGIVTIYVVEIPLRLGGEPRPRVPASEHVS